MSFKKFYINEDEDLYYVAMTLGFEGTYHVIAISHNSDEANMLVTKNTPFLVQTTTLPPMNKKELNDWLDKMAEYEMSKKIHYTFYHGKDVDKRLTTL
jgi:hypothetical protein